MSATGASPDSLAGKLLRTQVVRRGLNRGAYRGETIHIDEVLRECRMAAQQHGWMIEDLPVAPQLRLMALYRPTDHPRRRVYFSSGIHGDEPAGPLAVRQLLRENLWPPGIELWMCPCLNPTGFPNNLRENVCGLDLNRDYRECQSLEIRAHIAWLERQPDFDLAICLHEDWEAHGFYLYELNPGHQFSLANPIIAAVSSVCPIDPSPIIEGRSAKNGVILPELDLNKRPQWPEALYLITHKTRCSYTLEAPSDFALSVRVNALVTAVNTILAHLDQDQPTHPENF